MFYVLMHTGSIMRLHRYLVWDSDKCIDYYESGRNIYSQYALYANLCKDSRGTLHVMSPDRWVMQPKYTSDIIRVNNTMAHLIVAPFGGMKVWISGVLYQTPMVSGKYPLQTFMPVVSTDRICVIDNIYGLQPVELLGNVSVPLERVREVL